MSEITYPNEVRVPEQTIPAHVIRATATPRSVALMVGMLPLRDSKSCDVTASGGAVWRLRHGFVVTLEFDDDGSATWHLDVERPEDDALPMPSA